MKLRLMAGLPALVSALVIAPSAWAATTIGEHPAGGAIACGGGTTFLQGATAGTGPSYTVPAGGGVITSWSTKVGSGAGQQAALKVLTITDETHYTVAATSPLTPLTASSTNTFPVRISVPGGATLGYYFPSGGPSQECAFELEKLATSSVSRAAAIPTPRLATPW